MKNRILLQGKEIEYKLKVSKLAKRISLNISEKGLVVVVPNKRSESFAQKFIVEKQDWLLKNLEKYEVSHFKKLEHGSTFEILSEEFSVLHVQSYQNEDIVKIEEKENRFLIYTNEINSQAALEKLSAHIRKHYAPLIKSRVEELAEIHGFNYAQISIRDQLTRWGSCTSKGNLNFNWRLVFAPLEVMDYVIIHELAHTVHMDHSKNFWNLVAKIQPDFRKNKNWLKINRQRLLEF